METKIAEENNYNIPFHLIHSDFIQKMYNLGRQFEDFWKPISLLDQRHKAGICTEFIFGLWSVGHQNRSLSFPLGAH